jgi:hypothetical protein
MTVEKISISLDGEVAAAARAAAEAEGLSLSAWLSRAANDAAALEAGRQAMREYEAEYGPIPEDAAAWAAEVLDRHGIRRR